MPIISRSARGPNALARLGGALCVAPMLLACSMAAAQTYGPGDPSPATAATLPALRTGPLPAALSLERALEKAEARAPAIAAARAALEASQARLRQAGLRANPQLDVTVENFAGTGPYAGLDGTETSVQLSQRLDLGGRRAARIGVAEAAVHAEAVRLAIARADLAQSVRSQFGLALAADARLAVARAGLARATELARIADELVAAGREPPLRAYRARANAAQADAALKTAAAEDETARRSLGALLGSDMAVRRVIGALDLARPPGVAPAMTLDARLAAAELAMAESGLRQARAEGRIDPSIGIGARRIEETGDRALLASLSMPIALFDRNQGNIAAARADIRAAQAGRDAAIVQAAARIGNAGTAFDAALIRVKALQDVAAPQAEEAVRLADLAYRAGRIPLTELLDAQEAFATAQTQLIDAHLALVEARAVLARAAAQ
ncbi:TolC family protein [Sphingomonas colocasiae]|uniref:TolC family protein n=1 Tax=Sphingomonas colocasiae TaxID=1848973 RepID=A0ABS7PWE9_9SPHN|nr:TolC family protein [Sphingomonas colocasiae]MBY8825687.1 TolC family protein [Sphingomonas colocasiae]